MNKIYRTSDVLFWVEAKILFNDAWLPYNWWNFPMFGLASDYIISINREVTQTSWYTFPVISVKKNLQFPPSELRAFHLIFPSSFKYQGKKINAYLFPPYYYHLWVLENEHVRLQPNPNPCARCGWYCNQNCHTLLSTDLHLL